MLRPTEEQLARTLESLSVQDAEEILSALASALFPSGPPALDQVTWTDRTPTSVPHPRQQPVDAEAQLRVAELRFRTLIEQIPAVTFMAVLGEGDNEVYVSPHIQSLLGFTQKEWLENPFLWYTQLHPDDRELWHQEFARGCRTGGPFQADCRFFARDGRVVWVHGEARLVRDERGRPLFLQGVAFDITEAKRAEALLLREAVRTTEARYRDLVEQVGTVFWEAEPDRPGFTYVSPGLEMVTGHSPERWVADPEFWLSCVHADDRDAAAQAWAAARLNPGGPAEFEFRILTANQRTIWVHAKAFAHVTEAGERRLFGLIFDITARKEAEDILRANEATLRTEAAIRRTLHRIGTALASELDIERLVQTATDEATQLAGAAFGAFFYNVIDARGEAYTLYTLSGVPREAFATFPMPRNTGLFGPTFRGEGPVRIADVHDDPRYGHNPPYHGMPPGHLPVRSYLAVPVISRTGEVLGGMFFGHPEPARFTEEHERLVAGIAGWTAVALENARLYASAARAREAAEVANRSKDEFLATISHELRTPLNAILGWAMLLRTGADDATVRRGIETIERNARAQTKIIEELLDVSRIVSGKLQLDPAPVDLPSIVEQALDAVRLAAENKRIDLRRQLGDQGMVIIGDATRLQQVVTNLLANAIKFTGSGGWIAVRLECAGERARLTVADNGQGISPAFLPHVFEPFRQADGSSTRVHGGLGLGLAIVQRLVGLHGGMVRAESPGVGRGSRFVVELPLHSSTAVSDDAGELAERDDEGEPLPEGVSLEGLTVLLVDDEADSGEVAAHFLRRVGAIVTLVSSVEEALAAVQRECPAVVVTDLGMPVRDGYDLLQHLRAMAPPVSAVPAIAVTAYARREDRDRALLLGFHAHVPKPVSPRGLVLSVARATGRLPSLG